MPKPRRSRPTLNPSALERLALRYVERFATTRARLVAYLTRKIAERGWEDEAPGDVAARIAERFAELGYVDDRAFAEARAASLTRRGLGARRVEVALRHAGIGDDDRQEIGADLRDKEMASALAYARRRRFGPFGDAAADRAQRERHAAAMMRAGHSPAVSRKIAEMTPGEETDELYQGG